MRPHSKRRVECRSINQLAPGSGEEQNTSPNTYHHLYGSGATIQSKRMFTWNALRYLHPGQGQILSKFLCEGTHPAFSFRLQLGIRLGRSLPYALSNLFISNAFLRLSM